MAIHRSTMSMQMSMTTDDALSDDELFGKPEPAPRRVVRSTPAAPIGTTVPLQAIDPFAWAMRHGPIREPEEGEPAVAVLVNGERLFFHPAIIGPLTPEEATRFEVVEVEASEEDAARITLLSQLSKQAPGDSGARLAHIQAGLRERDVHLL